MRIAVQDRVALALLHWAAERGDFEQEQIAVELLPYDNETIAQVADGNIDLLAAGAEVLLQDASAALDLRGVLVLAYSLEANAILARPGIRDVVALRGASIAIVADDSSSANDVLLAHALQERGLSMARVDISYLSEADALAAITAGDIDALVAGEPALSRIEQAAAASSGSLIRLADPSREAGLVADLLIGEERWLRANKETVKRVIRAWDRVVRALIREPQQAATAIADALATTPVITTIGLDATRLFDTEGNIELLRGTYQKAFSAMSVVLERRGQLRARGVPSANRYLDLAPLRQVARGR